MASVPEVEVERFMPLADVVVAFAECSLFLMPQPVTIALEGISSMARRDRDRYWRQNRDHGHGGVIGGIVLAGIGVVLLLQNLGIPFFQDLERYWPVILILVGVAQASRSV